MSEKQYPPKPVKPAERVTAYIDGFNLYHGMRDSFLSRYYWLSLPAMCTALLKPHQTLIATKYFTSRVTLPAEKMKRQTTYIEALLTLPGLTLHEGKYVSDVAECGECGAMVFVHNEKMTDVKIAIELTKDAHADRFDTALLVTGDSDQAPTVQMIRELFPRKRIISAFPPARVSKQLRKEAH